MFELNWALKCQRVFIIMVQTQSKGNEMTAMKLSQQLQFKHVVDGRVPQKSIY